MKKKLKAGSYQTFESFDQDAMLIYDNCMAYNAPGTTFYNGADRYKKSWDKFKLKYKDVDNRKALLQKVCVCTDMCACLGGSADEGRMG